jgi:predicted phosphodiesterase
MQLFRKDLPQDLDSAYILGVSDLHVGAPEFDAAYLAELLKWVQTTPNAYLLLNGDLGNYATKDSKSDVYADHLNPNQQRKLLKEYFEPVADRVLGVTEGNHELRIRTATSVDLCEDLADFLHCPYGREALCLQVRLGKNSHSKPVSYLVYATHGWSNSRGPGGKVNMGVSLTSVIRADVYIVGHTHVKYLYEHIFFDPDERNGNIIRQKQIVASSGSVLDYGGYAQAKGYPPGAKGIPRIRLDGKRKDVHASI